MARIESLMDAQEKTPEGDLLDVLVSFVEAYERRHYPVDLPDPVSAIRFYMEQNGLAFKDMESALGRLNRVYEVFNATHPLTLKIYNQVRAKESTDFLFARSDWLIYARRDVVCVFWRGEKNFPKLATILKNL